MRTATPSEALIRRRARQLTRALAPAGSGDAESVHHARVATRRIREALPLVARGARRRKLARRMRRLTRALGRVRELDVTLQMLDELGRLDDAPRAALAHMKQVTRHERRHHHSGLRDVLRRLDAHKLREALIASSGRRRGRAAHGDELRLDRARARAARRAVRLRQAIEHAGAVYLPDRLHVVRLAVKKLRYALEVARELSRSQARSRIDALRGVQDLLGRMHDVEVLIARVRLVQGAPAAPDFRLSADLDRLVRRLETECRRLHAIYMSARRKLIDICEHTIASSGDGRRPSAETAA